ncbi:MAG: hypothetical protein U9Q00_05605, partial [Synergistota bacterium]|nr:hypothetical protein [Synergistota bacterium]
MKKTLNIVFAMLSVLFMVNVAFGSCEGSSGGGEGGTSASASATKKVMAAAVQYLKDGNCGRFMPVAQRNLNEIEDEKKASIMYLMCRCYFKGGDYDKGKVIIMEILKTRYDAVTDLLGDREKVRTLAAALFAGEAGRRGKAEDVKEVQAAVEKDSTLDRLLVRDSEGTLVSRTKLSYVLKFHEAQAYKNS